ncbi:MAG: serine/threonine-protein kinase [Gemmataceae bacterium]
MPPTDADTFVRRVVRSRLLRLDEVLTALRAVPKAQRDDPQALADCLVRAGKLSRFQAGKLLRGVTHGMVIGPFRVLAPLGRGGMGTVFLVRDVRNFRLAALKILPPRLAKEARMRARFQREMEMCRKVSHPNLAEAYDVGQYRGVSYIAMEFIPGRTLSRLVAAEGRLDVPRVARLFADVADALHHAHGQGLIHRDLKPSNILVTPRDVAKVVDLGLALMHGETGEDSTVIGGRGYIVGTMDYIAPEQTTDAANVGPRGDLYSLGCTIYFALAGHPPFPGGSSKEKVFRHRTEVPTPLRRLRPGLPAGFVAFVERLMCKDPEGRPANAEVAADELRAWADGDATEDVVEDTGAMPRPGPPGSTEYSLFSLPHVEVLDEAEGETPAFPAWLVALLGAVPVLLIAALVAWWASRR